jgi:hypothetical protein
LGLPSKSIENILKCKLEKLREAKFLIACLRIINAHMNAIMEFWNLNENLTKIHGVFLLQVQYPLFKMLGARVFQI